MEEEEEEGAGQKGRMAGRDSGQAREAVNVLDNWISLAGEGDIASSRGPGTRRDYGGLVVEGGGVGVVIVVVARCEVAVGCNLDV